VGAQTQYYNFALCFTKLFSRVSLQLEIHRVTPVPVELNVVLFSACSFALTAAAIYNADRCTGNLFSNFCPHIDIGFRTVNARPYLLKAVCFPYILCKIFGSRNVHNFDIE
jgi:hypothetical protein